MLWLKVKNFTPGLLVFCLSLMLLVAGCNSGTEPPKPVISSFTASQKELPIGGGAVVLQWSVTGATTLEIEGVGPVSGVNSMEVSVQASRTFTLKATNANGTTSATEKVDVSNMGEVVWRTTLGTNDFDFPYDITAIPVNSSGQFAGVAVVGFAANTVSSPLGNRSILAAKLSEDGILDWSQQIGNKSLGSISLGNANGYGIVEDASNGGIYLSGWAEILGPDGTSNIEAVVLQMMPYGLLLRLMRPVNNDARSQADKVAVDGKENLYVVGTQSVYQSSSSTFISKLNIRGDHLWSRVIGPRTSERGNSIGVTPDGKVLVAVSYEAFQQDKCYVFSYDSNGNPPEGVGSNHVLFYEDGCAYSNMEIDSAGNVYLEKSTYLGYSLEKRDPRGKLLWTRAISGAVGIEVNKSGEVYVLDVRKLTKFDSNGNLIWVKSLLPPNFIPKDGESYEFTSMAEDSKGYLYLAGIAHPNVIPSALGESNMYIVKLK